MSAPSATSSAAPLTANDYKAMSATTGKEALSLFFSHRPDLVLWTGLPTWTD